MSRLIMFETVDLGAAKDVVKKPRLGKAPVMPPVPPRKQPAASLTLGGRSEHVSDAISIPGNDTHHELQTIKVRQRLAQLLIQVKTSSPEEGDRQHKNTARRTSISSS